MAITCVLSMWKELRSCSNLKGLPFSKGDINRKITVQIQLRKSTYDFLSGSFSQTDSSLLENVKIDLHYTNFKKFYEFKSWNNLSMAFRSTISPENKLYCHCILKGKCLLTLNLHLHCLHTLFHNCCFLISK